MNVIEDNTSTNNNVGPAVAVAANDAQEQDQKQEAQHLPIPTPTPTIHRLPVLVPRPHPHQPIRALDAESFADLHLAHLTSDVPDAVLFPFLHGLEGDNVQQNAFFAASSGLDVRAFRNAGGGAEGGSSAAEAGAGARGWNACGSAARAHAPNVVKVPEYRGLLWVACDEEQDEERTQAGYVFDPHLHSFSQPSHDSAEFEDEDFDFDEYEDEEFEDASDEQDGEDEVDDASEDEHMGELMQLDDVQHHSAEVENNNILESNNDNADPDDATHMHPQALRKPTASAPIAIQTGPHFVHNHSSHHYASSSSHHHNVSYAHTQHHHSTINFPTSSSSPASLASPSSPDGVDENAEGLEYDHEGVRRLSTSSVSTAETVSSSASASTSASDSTHSHFGFQNDTSFGFGSRASGGDEGFVASASYSTTASSIVDSHFKHDKEGELDVLDSGISSPTSTTSPTDTDTDADLAGLTTPCTSPMTDINIDDCIPSVSSLPPLTSSDLVMPSAPATAVPSHPPPPYTAQSSTSIVTVTPANVAALTSTPKAAASTAANDALSSGSVSPVPLTPDVTALDSNPMPSSTSQSKSASPATESPPAAMSAKELKRLTVTSSFRASDLLTTDPRDGRPMFLPPRVPDGISLRNFGIQVPIYATLSDIVVYCASGNMKSRRAAFNLAEKFKLAIEKKAVERQRRYEEAGVEVVWVKGGRMGNAVPEEEGKREDDMDVEDDERRVDEAARKPKAYLVSYNVFVLSDPLPVLAQKAPWMLSRLSDPDYPSLEDEFARRISPASSVRGTISAPSDTPTSDPVAPMNSDGSTNTHLDENGAVKLLKDEAPPLKRILPAIDFAQRERDEMRELTKATPILGECVYLGNVNDVPLPQPRMRARASSVHVEEVGALKEDEAGPSGEQQHYGWGMMDMEMEEDDPFDSWDNPMGFDVCIECRDCARIPTTDQLTAATAHLAALDAAWTARRYQTHLLNDSSTMKRTPRPPPSASQVVHLYFPASPPCFSYTMVALNPVLDFLSGLVATRQNVPSTRKKKVLIYSSDGYTESSVLALSLLMKERALDLPGAYLDLQVEKGRSFFVYQSDLGMLKRIEAHLQKQRMQFNALPASSYSPFRPGSSRDSSDSGERERRNWDPTAQAQAPPARETGAAHPYARSPRNSISYPASVNGFAAGDNVRGPPAVVPSQAGAALLHGRPRALTSPMLFPHIDHQTWFNDPRFDGSFPSRVLPFLYLGNLNHAQNAYMLHALGITHVVSVGECALVPPANIATDDSSSGYHLVAGRGPGGHGSLWMEEREGRIKVLDIKGVCDDGIDSLQHQLAPVCEWMEKAREEGGKILVHCRVGVSRSATVTIAYVMKHLEIPLVDAYLIVRSRRLNVLIQPNMRLLYNLCGWEVELARDRAKGDVSKLRRELSRSLNWPYLAREVHRLNEKYLH